MNGSVYIIYNNVDGKQYVGQTWDAVASRWKGHCYDGKSNYCRKIKNAIKKHGHENFSVILLCECVDQKEMDDWEDFFIVFFGTIGQNGYNLRRGGSHGKMSEESKKRMSASRKGRRLSEAHRLAISKGSIGKKMSEEAIRKISENSKRQDRTAWVASHTGHKHSDKTKVLMSASQKLRRIQEQELR